MHAISIQTGPQVHTELTLNEKNITVQKYAQSKLEIRHDIDLRHILNATFDDREHTLTVACLVKTRKTLQLFVVEGKVDPSQATDASQWTEAVMKVAYDDAGISRSRHFMVLVNPYGGRKKAVSIFQKKMEPVLKAAKCSFEVQYTTHQGHAKAISKNLPLHFDAVITVSGDGLVHEVLNGFSEHQDRSRALSIPIAPIPTGSGNALCLNLLGIDEGLDVLVATLNAIKGQPMKVDLLTFNQGGKRTVSFMSQSLGLMADLDVGTDNLRWMGESRFLFGFIRGILVNRKSPIQLSYKLAESDKYKMAMGVANRHRARVDNVDPTLPSPTSTATQRTLRDSPDIQLGKHFDEDEEGWTIFPHPILYLYGGKGPYVGRDFMAFPVSLPDDGLIDLTVMTDPTRGEIFATMDGAPAGLTYWHPKVHYVKAYSYRVKPLQKQGHLSVDGEPFPFEEFQVDVERGAATVLSPYGNYAAKFDPINPS